MRAPRPPPRRSVTAPRRPARIAASLAAVRAAPGLAAGLCLALVPMLFAASPTGAAAPKEKDNVELRVYVNDACVVADEPFFQPVPADAAPGDARFLPLLGLVIGKVAELFVNHEIQSSVDKMKNKAQRKDTRYAMTRQMNLYRADFQPAPTLRINAHLGCMTIVAATFRPEPVDCTADYVPKALAADTRQLPPAQWKSSRSDESVENQLRRANICVAGNARAVYEARFEFSPDGTAYRLRDAGYRIESLLTSGDKNVSRTTIYTLKITDPAATDQQEVLSSAWVSIGTVSPGSKGTGGGGADAPWLRVPTLSVDARRIYDEKTRVHQEVMGEIDALKRAQVRNERILAGLDRRIATAGSDTVEGLKQERTRIAVQSQSQAAELEARNAEYQDLPRTPLEFMPVTIEVAVTESESEKKSQLALADIIGKNSDFVGSAVGTATSGLLSKSVSARDLEIDEAAGSAGDIGTARRRYFDAKVAADHSLPGAERAKAEADLSTARAQYNEARHLQGLEPIQ